MCLSGALHVCLIAQSTKDKRGRVSVPLLVLGHAWETIQESAGDQRNGDTTWSEEQGHERAGSRQARRGDHPAVSR